MKELAEVMEKSKAITELKEKLVDCVKSEVGAKGLNCMEAEEMGEVVDMIKDLAEAEKCCMEALYFQKVVEAMTSYEEPRYGESMGYHTLNMAHNPSSITAAEYTMGYNPNRNSLGQYSSGYVHPEWANPSMGYRNGSSSNSSNSSSGYMPDTYNEYVQRRKYYTASNDPEDKKEMEVKAEEHIHRSIITMRDIWKDADPVLKKRMREELVKLLNDMPAQ